MRTEENTERAFRPSVSRGQFFCLAEFGFGSDEIKVRDQQYEAEAALHKAVALQPAAARVHVYLTTIHVLRGNATGALQDAQLEPPGSWRDYALALARVTQSDRAAADAALQKLINENAETSPFQIAAVYGLRNEPDKMFEWLDRAYIERDSGLTQLLVTPFILNHKNDPRFAAFCQKLKVPVPTTVVTKP